MNIFLINKALYGPLLLAGGVLIVAGWIGFGTGKLLPFTSQILVRECQRLDSLQKNILTLRNQNRRLEKEVSPLTVIQAGAVIGSKETAAEKLREIVERIAAQAGLTVRSLREIQHLQATINWNISTISFSAECSINSLQNFLNQLEKQTPRLYWQNVTIRPDNTNSPTQIIIDGQLALLNIPEEKDE